MPSRTARLSKKGCGFATPECRAQRDVAVHPRPAPPPPLPAAPRLSTTALGYLEIRWVVRCTQLPRQPHPRRRPLQQNLAPKAHQPGRSPARLCRALARFLHQALCFDETTKVLLMQANAREGFHRALELQEREGGRHEFEHHGPILNLAP